MVLVLFLFCVASVFSLGGISCWVLPCSFFSCSALWFLCLGKREFVYILLIHLYVYLACITIRLFLFLLVSGVGCRLWLWHSLDFSFNFVIRLLCFLMTSRYNTMTRKSEFSYGSRQNLWSLAMFSTFSILHTIKRSGIGTMQQRTMCIKRQKWPL